MFFYFQRGDLLDALINESECVFSARPPENISPHCAHTSLLSTELGRNESLPSSCRLPHHVISILQDTHDFLIENSVLLASQVTSVRTPTFDITEDKEAGIASMTRDEKQIDWDHHTARTFESCRLATTMNHYLVRANFSPLSDPKSQGHVHKLKVALTQIDDSFWLRSAPEVLTGAATSSDRLEQLWFVSRLGPVAISLGLEGLDNAKEGIVDFHRLLSQARTQ